MRLRGRSAAGNEVIEVETEGELIASVTSHASSAEAESLPVIAAGLLDAQVNGFGGFDVNAEDVEPGTIVSITNALAAHGVTSWVPTVITGSRDRIIHALDSIRRARDADPRIAAAIPCAHVEGPFISRADGARGVHDLAHIRPIDADEVADWLRAGPVGVITVSGEETDAPDHIRRIRAMGVAVSVGHTAADHTSISRAVDAGATLATHLGNGIPALIPRHPNPIWTLLADDRVRVGLIADGHHLPAETLTAMIRAKGPGGAYLVSDLTALGGAAPGRYTTPVGGDVELSDDLRLSHVGSAMLAGAAATLLDGVRFIARRTPLGLETALELASRAAASATPETRAGLGALRAGAPADVLLLDTDTLTPAQVVARGELVG